MKLMLALEKEGATIGIGRHPINRRCLKPLLVHGFGIITSGAYFFNGAQSFREYSDSVFLTSVMIGVAICYAIALSKMKDFFECVDETERIIEESKFD